jgi:hypothetical protein
MPDRRDPSRIRHEMVELVMARAAAINCGYKDGNNLDRLRDDPMLKIAIGRCPESGEPLPSQSTISRLENAPKKTDAARLTGALVDQFCASVTPGEEEILDIDDAFCTAHGGQQLGMRTKTSAGSRGYTSIGRNRSAVVPAARSVPQ